MNLNFIDGEFVNPSAESYIDFVKALQGANKAFVEWKDSNLEDRINLIDKTYTYLNEHKNKFAEVEALDQSLSFKFTMGANIEMALARLKNLKTELTSEIPADQMSLPVGVVGVVLSWNLSTRLFVEKVIPAVLAGNAVIVKLSSLTPGTAKLWGDLLQHIGVAKGLVQILHSQDVAFKKLFVTHPGIKALLVTGSLETASEIIKSVASVTTATTLNFKKIQIHSGSKNSAVVLKDMNEADMTEVLNSFLQGQGQLVWNSARLFVLEKHEKTWMDFVAHKLHELKPSQGIHDDSPWTPLVKTKSVENFATLMAQARTDQAKIISTEAALPSNKFVKPFFTKDMSNCSILQQDQVLGPAFILSTVKYPFDIPKYSNVSYYGHSSSVWTELGKNQKTIQQLDVGLVSLNKWSIYSETEITGVKQSSFGNMNRQIFGDFYCNVKKLT